MVTSSLSLQLNSQSAHGAQVSGFPPQVMRSWTGNSPTVQRVTLAAEDDTEITLPANTKLVASPMTDGFNLRLKGEAADAGTPLCFEDSALGLAWVQPWDGSTTSFWIENLEADDIEVEIYAF